MVVLAFVRCLVCACFLCYSCIFALSLHDAASYANTTREQAERNGVHAYIHAGNISLLELIWAHLSSVEQLTSFKEPLGSP